MLLTYIYTQQIQNKQKAFLVSCPGGRGLEMNAVIVEDCHIGMHIHELTVGSPLYNSTRQFEGLTIGTRRHQYMEDI